MKDIKCKSKDCNRMINSKMNKSGLCYRCLSKEWKRIRRPEMLKYSKDWYEKTKKKRKKEIGGRNKRYYKEHKKYLLDWHKNHYENNKEECKEYSKEYFKKNKKKVMGQKKERYKNDENYRIRVRLGTTLTRVIAHYIKKGIVLHPLKRYDIDWEGIISVLIPIPKDRHNYHVDHIKPFVAFDLTDYYQVKEVMKPENHRWMLAKDNISKGGRTCSNN